MWDCSVVAGTGRAVASHFPGYFWPESYRRKIVPQAMHATILLQHSVAAAADAARKYASQNDVPWAGCPP